MEEDIAMGIAMANITLAILNAFSVTDLSDLRRSIYKHTECGAHMALRLHDGRVVYNGGNIDKFMTADVRAIAIGSIVEGVEECAETRWFDLMDYVEKPYNEAVDSFNKIIKAVDDEVSQIWNKTHGCERCHTHWVTNGFDHNPDGNPISNDDGTPSYGVIPVWDDCPVCQGSGSII